MCVDADGSQPLIDGSEHRRVAYRIKTQPTLLSQGCPTGPSG